METFHAVTGIVWPDLPPWPSLSDGASTASASSSKPKGGSKRSVKAVAGGNTKGNVNGNNAIGDANGSARGNVNGNNATGSGNTVSPGATTTASGVELPEEFRLLKEGPRAEDAAALEASSWEGTGGQRFLQMRGVGAEAMAAAAAAAVGLMEGGAGGGGVGSGGGLGGLGVSGPLRLPALGAYVGGCRPNALLVATLVKAHGRRRRLDDACRVVLGMVDWGLKPDVAVFNSLAAAAVWNGRIDLALEVRGGRAGGRGGGGRAGACKKSSRVASV